MYELQNYEILGFSGNDTSFILIKDTTGVYFLSSIDGTILTPSYDTIIHLNKEQVIVRENDAYGVYHIKNRVLTVPIVYESLIRGNNNFLSAKIYQQYLIIDSNNRLWDKMINPNFKELYENLYYIMKKDSLYILKENNFFFAKDRVKSVIRYGYFYYVTNLNDSMFVTEDFITYNQLDFTERAFFKKFPEVRKSFDNSVNIQLKSNMPYGGPVIKISNKMEGIHYFGNGKVVRKLNSKFGITDFNDLVLVPFVYDSITFLHHLNYFVGIENKESNKKKGFVYSEDLKLLYQVDNYANVINAKVYSTFENNKLYYRWFYDTSRINLDISRILFQGDLVAINLDRKKGTSFIGDFYGNLLTPEILFRIEPVYAKETKYKNKYFIAASPETGRSGVLDVSGQWIIPLKYTEIKYINQDYFYTKEVLTERSTTENGMVLKLSLFKGDSLLHTNLGGKSYNLDVENNYFQLSDKNGNWLLFDQNFKPIFDKHLKYVHCSKKFCIVKCNNQWGVMRVRNTNLK